MKISNKLTSTKKFKLRPNNKLFKEQLREYMNKSKRAYRYQKLKEIFDDTNNQTNK